MPIDLQPLAAEVAHELAPLLLKDDENGNAGSHLIAVLNAPIEVVAQAVGEDEDERPGFSAFLDLDRCPPIALAWLAQLKGVRLAPGLAESDPELARDEVRLGEGLRRGTIGSLQRAAARHTASKDPSLVRVLDRVGGDMYATTVITRTSDTPDPVQTLADILSDKIVGEIITHVVSDAPIIDEMTRTIGAITETIDALTLGGTT